MCLHARKTHDRLHGALFFSCACGAPQDESATRASLSCAIQYTRLLRFFHEKTQTTKPTERKNTFKRPEEQTIDKRWQIHANTVPRRGPGWLVYPSSFPACLADLQSFISPSSRTFRTPTCASCQTETPPFTRSLTTGVLEWRGGLFFWRSSGPCLFYTVKAALDVFKTKNLSRMKSTNVRT